MTEDHSLTTTKTFSGPPAEQCLRLEAAGQGHSRAMITIPSLVKPGEPFGDTVSLLDANAMPIIAGDETQRERD